jgi:hypothetical protein
VYVCLRWTYGDHISPDNVPRNLVFVCPTHYVSHTQGVLSNEYVLQANFSNLSNSNSLLKYCSYSMKNFPRIKTKTKKRTPNIKYMLYIAATCCNVQHVVTDQQPQLLALNVLYVITNRCQFPQSSSSL